MKLNKLRDSVLDFVGNRAFVLIIGIVVFFNLFISSGIDIANDAFFPLPDCDAVVSNEVEESDVEDSGEIDDSSVSKEECLKELGDAEVSRGTTSFFFRVVSGAIIVISGLMQFRRRLLAVSFVASGIVSVLIGVLTSDLGGFEWFIVTGCFLIILILLALRQVSK